MRGHRPDITDRGRSSYEVCWYTQVPGSVVERHSAIWSSAQRAHSPIDRSWSSWNRSATGLMARRSGNGTSSVQFCSTLSSSSASRASAVSAMRGQRRPELLERPAVGEEHLHHSLELERRRRRWLVEPPPQRLPAARA